MLRVRSSQRGRTLVVVDVHYEVGESEGDCELWMPFSVAGETDWFDGTMEEPVSRYNERGF
jgi:hypothetical protein